MSDDTTLGDPTPAPAGHDAHVPSPETATQWTIEEILAEAELPEKYARVCVKASLQAEHDDLVARLAALVDASGEPIGDGDDASAGDVSARGRAHQLNERLTAVREEMAAAMWFPLFRGLSSWDMAVFEKEHMPKGDNPDMSDYNLRLISATAIRPALSIDEVKALRRKLGTRAMVELVNTAHEVCARGGVDVPKLPGFLRSPSRQ